MPHFPSRFHPKPKVLNIHEAEVERTLNTMVRCGVLLDMGPDPESPKQRLYAVNMNTTKDCATCPGLKESGSCPLEAN
jgi:hypothetical protein